MTHAEHSHGNAPLAMGFGDRDRKAFGELIELAEKVQAEKDALNRQISISLAVLFFLVIAVASIMSTVLGTGDLGAVMRSPVGLFLLTIFAAAYVAAVYLYAAASRRLRREKRAFEQVMGVVHEVFESTKEDFSALEVAEIKIRLSRLDH